MSEVESALAPEYFYDFDVRQVVLLGGVALDEVISFHPYMEVLADMDKVRILPEGPEIALPTLHDLITIPGAIPEGFEKRKNEFENISKEECIEYGRWLMFVANRPDGALFAKHLDRAGRLGLGPSGKMVRSHKRFGGIHKLQEELGQTRIIRRGELSDKGVWDIAKLMRQIAKEEGQRPTEKVLERRFREGRTTISPRSLRILGTGLSEIYEKAGFLDVRAWDKRKFLEWGYLFALSNDRLFVRSDLNQLSPLGRSPSIASKSPVVTKLGGITSYQEEVRKFICNRQKLATTEIRKQLENGDLPLGLTDNLGSLNELLQRAGRYRIISELLPNEKDSYRLRISKTNVTGSEFVEELEAAGDVPAWMAEAAAWEFNCVPELFPDGELVKSLQISR